MKYVIIIALLLSGCSAIDQENIAIGQANQQHAMVCAFGGGIC
jgi:uncharacterized protein YceK